MHKNKKSGAVGIIITILLLIILVVMSNTNIDKFSQVENVATKLIMPIQNGITYLKNKIQGNSTFFSDINNLKAENEELKKRNSELEQSIRELEIVKAENGVLKEYVNLKDSYTGFVTTPAYIIDRDISNYSSTLIINIGAKDGIKENMTVIADKGLVGHIISVTDTTAKVQVIIDPASTTSCTINTTRDAVVCRGILEKNNTLKAIYIPTDAKPVKGDSIETSGMGGIYPKGITIGTIQEIIETKNITDRYLLIDTAVDFSTIETVLVITSSVE